MKGKPLKSFNQAGKTAASDEKGGATLSLAPCLACGRQVTGGYYGRFDGGGVCSKKCNDIQSEKPRYQRPVRKGLEEQVAQ